MNCHKFEEIISQHCAPAVSYTHLDVYKRQRSCCISEQPDRVKGREAN